MEKTQLVTWWQAKLPRLQRALRGHMLVDKCLHSQLITEVVKDNPDIRTLLDEAEELYLTLLNGEKTLADAAAWEVLIELETVTYTKKLELAQTFHVVRRSNQCWAKLSSDLVIQQTLMRSNVV